MVSFHEVQFPPKIAYGASGGPEFNTTINANLAGFEQRNINWPYARGKWDVSTGIKLQSDMATVIAFFRARFGKAYGFRFKDWADYQGIAESIGTGDGSTKIFQLVRNYVSGGYSYQRPIKKPVAGTVNIYLNSVLQSSGFTLDTTTGLVTFTAAPALGVLVGADFQFDVPARFDTDNLAARADSPGLFIWDAIPIVEIRL